MTLRADTVNAGGVSILRVAQWRLAPLTHSRVIILVLFGMLVILSTSCVSTPPDQASENSESRFLQEQQLKGLPVSDNR
jgi:hypothetical protein